MRFFGALLSLFIIISAEAQQDTTFRHEVAFDGFISASNLGGTFSAGIKYVMVKNQKLAYGPSLRLQRVWSNNVNGGKYGYNIYGGGAFLHYRLKNVMFAGAEFELLRTPIFFSGTLPPTQWVPTLFVGGGYSHEFSNIGIRLNAGVFYDIINHMYSPFRQNYVLKLENGVLMPVIYRIGFHFILD